MERPAAAIAHANRSYVATTVKCSEHPHCQRVSYLYTLDSCDTQMAAKVGTVIPEPLYERVGNVWRVKL